MVSTNFSGYSRKSMFLIKIMNLHWTFVERFVIMTYVKSTYSYLNNLKQIPLLVCSLSVFVSHTYVYYYTRPWFITYAHESKYNNNKS